MEPNATKTQDSSLMRLRAWALDLDTVAGLAMLAATVVLVYVHELRIVAHPATAAALALAALGRGFNRWRRKT